MYSESQPYDEGMLDVGDGHRVHWEAHGNPLGRPALVVHGGPGSGSASGATRYFDPARHRTILFDQRGCGRSTPHAADPTVDLRTNTTSHLLADMERLRVHLGIDRWLLYGGSWGSTLLLAYAERHPERVSGIVVHGVTTTRRPEIAWLYEGVGALFPEAWDRFRAGSGTGARTAAELVSAYARLTGDPDRSVREKATADWCAWEDAVVSQEGAGTPYGDRPGAAQLAFVRICAHYFSHAAWLEEDALLRNAHRLAGIPGVLVHGRFDVAAPLTTAWELAKAWPDAELIVTDGAGHLGTETTRGHVKEAVARLTAQ
ncbi:MULTISPECIES: prolyl aminopeptidase [unclassified Streptomyces]|uniref:prolyl aminopeptidase n=1 Tax=unclassified Streptomyces TaxID=2593676 RepID=UPI0008DE45F5|nr:MULTISPECIES: prolyl aminopeptidase [unclassified Streptomyces]OII68361.1 prolyl aminopeptidase [Streptomyces sp. CC77]